MALSSARKICSIHVLLLGQKFALLIMPHFDLPEGSDWKKDGANLAEGPSFKVKEHAG